MSLIAKGSKGTPTVEAGLHICRCVRLIDFGTHYSEKYKKENHRIRIEWEFPNERREGEDGEYTPCLGRSMNLSLGKFDASKDKRTALRDVLESWRGKAFTETEFEGFDLKNIIDKPATLNIMHDEGNAQVASVMPLQKDAVCPPAHNKIIEFYLETPDRPMFDALLEWHRKQIMESKEWADLEKAWGMGDAPQTPDEHNPHPAEDEDSDLPF